MGRMASGVVTDFYRARPAGDAGHFSDRGPAVVAYLREFAGLTPRSSVLDMGLSRGGIAVPLTGFLDDRGRYEGLDVDRSGAAGRSNFHFTVADVHNWAYHPLGRTSAEDHRLPYDDATFDVVVLWSVFTHLLPTALENYVAETGRVLKPGGCCVASFSLITADSLRAMASRRALHLFRRYDGPSWIADAKVPELAVAYEAGHVYRLLDRWGLSSDRRVRFGTWSGCPAPDGYDFVHDIVIATRPQECRPPGPTGFGRRRVDATGPWRWRQGDRSGWGGTAA